jgi:microcystin-dependent protein
MGSGCNNSPTNGKCFQITSDKCIQYTGDPVPILGICTFDRLNEIEQVIIERLITILDGTGIDLSDLTYDCDFIVNQLAGKDKNLAVVIQILIDSACTLNDLITTITDQVNTPIVYDPKCLTPTANTTPGLLQAAIDELCLLQTEVNNITTQLNNSGNITTTVNNLIGDYLLNKISGCGVVKTGSAATAAIEFTGSVPPFCPIFYVGSLANFDSNGKGLDNSCYKNWYICNGNFQTPDMRGYSPAGAITLPGINSPTLDAIVDPTQNGNDPSYQTSILDKKGKVKVPLTISEGPNHSHVLNDPKHSHGGVSSVKATHHTDDNSGNENFPLRNVNGQNYGSSLDTTSSTGITIASSGNSTPHENRPPTLFGVFIMRKS